MAQARPHRKNPPPTWAQIASFYAGSPQTFSEDTRGPLSGTTGAPVSGNVRLGKGLMQGLADFLKQLPAARRGDKNAMQRAAILGTNPLAVLIHESIHNRNFAEGMGDQWFTPWLDDKQQNPGTGFYGPGNEAQAAALGAELLPDLLNRFFGIGLNSPLSKRMAKLAKQRGEYTGAYARGGSANG